MWMWANVGLGNEFFFPLPTFRNGTGKPGRGDTQDFKRRGLQWWGKYQTPPPRKKKKKHLRLPAKGKMLKSVCLRITAMCSLCLFYRVPLRKFAFFSIKTKTRREWRVAHVSSLLFPTPPRPVTWYTPNMAITRSSGEWTGRKAWWMCDRKVSDFWSDVCYTKTTSIREISSEFGRRNHDGWFRGDRAGSLG